jgi:hypothetical protein
MTLEKFNEIIKFSSEPCKFPIIKVADKPLSVIVGFYSNLVIPYASLRKSALFIANDTFNISSYFAITKNGIKKCNKNELSEILLQNSFTKLSDLLKHTKKIDIIYDLIIILTIQDEKLFKNNNLIYCNILDVNWQNNLTTEISNAIANK